jgi:hypothetical protein
MSEHVARDALQRFRARGRLETIRPASTSTASIRHARRPGDQARRRAARAGRQPFILCPRASTMIGQKILIEAVKRLGHDDVFCLLLG